METFFFVTEPADERVLSHNELTTLNSLRVLSVKLTYQTDRNEFSTKMRN